MTLRKSKVNYPVDMLNYTSKVFTIQTSWDGGTYYIITVFDEINKLVLETLPIEGEFKLVEDKFEELKTKYILK